MKMSFYYLFGYTDQQPCAFQFGERCPGHASLQRVGGADNAAVFSGEFSKDSDSRRNDHLSLQTSQYYVPY
jgi:hypothetical protein